MKLTVPSVSCHQPTQLTHAPEAIVAWYAAFSCGVHVVACADGTAVVVELPQTPEDDLRSARGVCGRRTS